jgi:hypothetical protein
MIRAAIAICLAASPALADTCDFGANGTRASIAPHPQAWAQVVIDNRLAPRFREGPCVLHHDGRDVVVMYAAEPGRDPDEFTVTPPDGFVADPGWLILEDGAATVVIIWEWAGM